MGRAFLSYPWTGFRLMDLPEATWDEGSPSIDDYEVDY